jgi:hypothetical protein
VSTPGYAFSTFLTSQAFTDLIPPLSLECSLKQKPNLVLINAGTNDCLKNIDIKNAGGRMRKIIDRLFSQTDGTTVLLSTLIVNGDVEANANVENVNTQYRQIVKDMAARGRKIALAEMNNGFITVEDISKVDQTHPTNDGYRKLAAVWADAFTRVAQKGWITEPVDNGRPDDTDNDCQPTSGNFRGPVRTQNGGQPAYNDGLYNHAQALVGNVSSALWTVPKRLPGIHKQFHFAQLVNLNGVDRGAETDELIRILDPHQRGNALPHVAYQLNTNGHYGGDWVKIDVGTECLNRGVRWGDINGDGLDDFICLSYPVSHPILDRSTLCLDSNYLSRLVRCPYPSITVGIHQLSSILDWFERLFPVYCKKT